MLLPERGPRLPNASTTSLNIWPEPLPLLHHLPDVVGSFITIELYPGRATNLLHDKTVVESKYQDSETLEFKGGVALTSKATALPLCTMGPDD
jgi:hypothetical protein